MTKRRKKMVDSLSDKESRDLFVEEHINQGIAFQIRRTREARGWSQRELGHAAEGIAQPVISDFENPDYGSYTLNSLKRLASAFDVALIVRFAPYSELVDWVVSLSPNSLAVAPFDRDVGLASLPAAAPAGKSTLRHVMPSGGTVNGLLQQGGNIIDFETAARGLRMAATSTTPTHVLQNGDRTDNRALVAGGRR